MQVSFAAHAASCEQLQRPPTQVNSWAQSVSTLHSGRAAQTPLELQTWPLPQSVSERQMGPHAPRRQRCSLVQSLSVAQGVELTGGQALSAARIVAAARAREWLTNGRTLPQGRAGRVVQARWRTRRSNSQRTRKGIGMTPKKPIRPTS